ncbi:MAG: hypothetical protein QOD72_3202 [Acidimicrobiaceae bacterium]|nr:hypothetical protein [Acidimicrobiaceae bacterium]
MQLGVPGTGWLPPRRPFIGFAALSRDSGVVGAITSGGTDVIETPSSETTGGALVVVVADGGVVAIDVDAAVAGAVDGAVSGDVERQPATRTAAASALHFMGVKVQPAARALNVGTRDRALTSAGACLFPNGVRMGRRSDRCATHSLRRPGLPRSLPRPRRGRT